MSTPQILPSILSRFKLFRRSGEAGQPDQRPSLRRPTPAQGRALEILGHAIEYLVDSRLASAGVLSRTDEQEAIKLLSRLNREIFAECPEILPTGARVKRWLAGRLFGHGSEDVSS
ncbi:MAG TPA: hypothetical protein VNW54_04695 [Granulicella sp.]|jgi:hypothetical protein|nr:hypothetical protein [Granulicella sp.]